MRKRIIVSILVATTYILSCMGAHRGFHYWYTTEWTHINPNGATYFFTFCPAVNTGLAIMYLLDTLSASEFFDVPKR
jgi:hypothetical protein